MATDKTRLLQDTETRSPLPDCHLPPSLHTRTHAHAPTPAARYCGQGSWQQPGARARTCANACSTCTISAWCGCCVDPVGGGGGSPRTSPPPLPSLPPPLLPTAFPAVACGRMPSAPLCMRACAKKKSQAAVSCGARVCCICLSMACTCAQSHTQTLPEREGSVRAGLSLGSFLWGPLMHQC